MVVCVNSVHYYYYFINITTEKYNCTDFSKT